MIRLNSKRSGCMRMVPGAENILQVVLGSEQEPTLFRPLLKDFFDAEYTAGSVNLIQGLARLIGLSKEWGVPILPEPLPGRVDDLLVSLSEAEDLLYFDLQEVPLELGGGTVDRNPFRSDRDISLEHHELAALVADCGLPPDLNHLYDQIRLLYLGYAWGSIDDIKAKRSLALEIRLFAVLSEESKWRREYLGLDPVREDVQLGYLVSKLRDLPSLEQAEQHSYRDRWRAALIKLRDFWQLRLSDDQLPSQGPDIELEELQVDSEALESLPSQPDPSPREDAAESTNGGGLDRVDRFTPKQISVQPGPRQNWEAPDQLVFHEEDIDETPEALSVFLGSSRFWLQDLYSLTSVSPGVLDVEERGVLCELFSSYPDKGIGQECEPLLLLELAYNLGLDPSECLDLTLGSMGVLSPEGVCWRQINIPEQSYAPDEDKKHRFRDLLEQFPLKLRGKLRTRLKPYMPSKDPISLGARLKASSDDLVAAVDRIVEDLNEEHDLELTVTDVSLALRNQVYLETRNPAVTLHIAGSDGDAPPAMSWYQGVDKATLTSTYELVVESMYGDA